VTQAIPFASGRTALAGILLAASLAGCVDRAGDKAAQSVILIVLDAASLRHFGVYGYEHETTPEIDRLAVKGDVFLNAYSPAPFTRAAMIALWTSREPGAEGAPEAPRLSERLSARGIHTAGFVGNPNVGPTYSFDRGFAEFHETYPSGPQAETFRPLLEHFLRENRDRRFFAWVHYREPHFPYDPPPEFAERFPLEKISRQASTDQQLLDAICGRTGGPTAADRRDLARLYDANLAYVDAEVGWLWRQVVAAGLAETTAIVLTSDHGEALCEHGFVGHNYQVYDESVRVPLIVRRPGAFRQRRHETLVSLLDIAPTVMGLLGLDEDLTGFEGRDILVETPPDAPPRTLFSRSANKRPNLALRDEDFAFVYTPAFDRTELFDRRRDPDELHDISADHPELVRRYRAEALARAERLKGPIVPPPSELTPEVREKLEALGYAE
jgi:arylsulfatase A-like enzyme